MASAPAVAESQPNMVARADAVRSPAASEAVPLPSVPKLVLSLPPLAQRAESSGAAYWDAVLALGAWRGASDGQLRLRVETAQLEWAGFELSAGITSIPEHERECAPSCTGPEWSSSVILRYPAGDVGSLRQVGPELEVGGKHGGGREGTPGVVKAGVGGAF